MDNIALILISIILLPLAIIAIFVVFMFIILMGTIAIDCLLCFIEFMSDLLIESFYAIYKLFKKQNKN